MDDAKKFPEARQLMRQETFPDPQKEAGYAQHRYEDDRTLSERTQELSLSTTSKQSSSQASSKVLIRVKILANFKLKILSKCLNVIVFL